MNNLIPFAAKTRNPRLVVREVESGMALGRMSLDSPLTTVSDSFVYLFEEHERGMAQSIADRWFTDARVVKWTDFGTTGGGAK